MSAQGRLRSFRTIAQHPRQKKCRLEFGVHCHYNSPSESRWRGAQFDVIARCANP
jgi:hypothetical protein